MLIHQATKNSSRSTLRSVSDVSSGNGKCKTGNDEDWKGKMDNKETGDGDGQNTNDLPNEATEQD
jgi:hypothetical protein